MRPGNQPRAGLPASRRNEPESTDEADRFVHKIRRKTIEVLLRHSSLGLREGVRELKEAQGLLDPDHRRQFEEIPLPRKADGERDDPSVANVASEAAASCSSCWRRARPLPQNHIMITMRSVSGRLRALSRAA